jgi:2-polyprenyl-6-methoxyphenol hydroxylase-like FAD-dependent oxidoreductase
VLKQSNREKADALVPIVVKRCIEVTNNTESVTATFKDGTTATGWLLVACDGAGSRIRRYLHPSAFENNPVPVRLIGITVSYTPAQVAAALAIDPYFFQGTHSESNIYLFFSCKLTLSLRLPFHGASIIHKRITTYF